MDTYESLEPTRLDLEKRFVGKYFFFIAPMNWDKWDKIGEFVREGLHPPRVQGVPVEVYFIEHEFADGHPDIDFMPVSRLRLADISKM